MKFLYNIGIGLYGASAATLGLFNPKAAQFVKGRKKALADLRVITAEVAPDGYDFWIHAASLGEFEQARPLIERIKDENPDAKILVTFFSPSGYNVRKNYALASAVVYLPSDTRSNAAKFIDIARPKCAIFVKYDFWLNFLEALHKNGVPTYLISAVFRKGQIFFKPFGSMFRKALWNYKRIFVQDENSKRLLEGIGVKDVVVTGDTRLDRVNDIKLKGEKFDFIDKWRNGHFTVIAGSSWPQDEAKYLSWINRHPEVRLIIAPHEFDEARLQNLEAAIQGKTIRWTQLQADNPRIDDDVKVVILDTFGKLSSIYRYADVAIIGGGFGAGIHNINEAAVYDIPVIFGPNNRKFNEAADLKRLSAGFEYGDSDSIASILDKLKDDSDFREAAGNAAGRYIADNKGATQLIYEQIKTDLK